jgi:hypothetical protein
MVEALTLSRPELESSDYTIGDVVSLIEGISSNPDNRWLLVSSFRDSPEGPIADAITLDDEGNATSGPGTIHLIDVEEKIDDKKDQTQVTTAFKQLLERTQSPLANSSYADEFIGKFYEK